MVLSNLWFLPVEIKQACIVSAFVAHCWLILAAVSLLAIQKEVGIFLVPSYAIQADFLSVTTVVFFLCPNSVWHDQTSFIYWSFNEVASLKKTLESFQRLYLCREWPGTPGVCQPFISSTVFGGSCCRAVQGQGPRRLFATLKYSKPHQWWYFIFFYAVGTAELRKDCITEWQVKLFLPSFLLDTN